jgi:toxin FitB
LVGAGRDTDPANGFLTTGAGSIYLIDTNVIFAGALAKSPSGVGPVAREDLVRWMDDESDALFLSVVTVAEIEDGIAKARRDRATRKAADLAE